MGRLTKAQIVAASDLKTEEVPVPEWGGEGAFVTIRQLSVAQMDLMRSNIGSGTSNQLIAGAEMLAMSIIDERGDRVFGDDELRALVQKNPKVVDRLAGICAKLNNLGGEDVDALEKNSVSAPSGEASSGLPLPSGAPLPNSSDH